MTFGVTLIILLIMGLSGKTIQQGEVITNYENCGMKNCKNICSKKHKSELDNKITCQVNSNDLRK